LWARCGRGSVIFYDYVLLRIIYGIRSFCVRVWFNRNVNVVMYKSYEFPKVAFLYYGVTGVSFIVADCDMVSVVLQSLRIINKAISMRTRTTFTLAQ